MSDNNARLWCVIIMKKISVLAAILVAAFSSRADSAEGRAPQKRTIMAAVSPSKISEKGLLEKIKNEFNEKKKKFEEQQKKQENNESKPKQEIVPTIVVFGSKENAAFIDNDLNKIELHLLKLEECLYKLSKGVSEKITDLIVDDDIKAEECKSKTIADILHRIHFYVQSVNQAIKLVHTGVAILTSISSIKDESYPTGCDNIVKGLFLFSFTETLAQTIRYEIDLLKPCMHPRHQQVLTSALSEDVPDILSLGNEFGNWAKVYKEEVCPRIAREDLKKSFSEQIPAIENFVKNITFFTSFIDSIHKYYSEKESPFVMPKPMISKVRTK